MPYLWSNASSTNMSSVKVTGVGKLWLYTSESSFGVNLTVNSPIIRMSNLCLANMLWNSTSNDSVLLISYCCNMESFQSKLSESFCLDASSSCGSSFAASCKLRSCVVLVRFAAGSVYGILRLLDFPVLVTNNVRIGHYNYLPLVGC